jgi:glycerophosphoryl diester phosphodiesterase
MNKTPYPHLCAHRGLSQACPENTLPAFAAAMAVGAHEIEFDLWLSRDGVPVVCHDAKVDRTTDGSGLIADLSWAEIQSLDAGIRLGELWRGIRMPRLEQVLELTSGRIGLNMHIKEAGPQGRLVKMTCDQLRDRGLLGAAYIAGDADVLQAARDHLPELARACLISQEGPDKQIDAALAYSCQRIQFNRSVTAEHTRRAHDAGILCNLFWSDEPEDGWQYVRNGIDVILTNRANVMISGGFKGLES